MNKMKIIIQFVLLFAIALPYKGNAHGGGFMEQCYKVPLPFCTSNNWNGITSTDSALYVVGNNGSCFIYYYKGDVKSVNTGIVDTLTGVLFIDNSVGFAWGKNGSLIKTSDKGLNWTPITTNTLGDISRVEFIDVNNGFFIVNDSIKKTVNGGASWSNLTLPVGINFKDFHFFDASNGQICGQQTSPSIAGFLYKTTNGGSSWTMIYTDTCAFSKMYYTSGSAGYLYGTTINQPLLLESNNAGAGWSIKYTRNNWNISSGVTSFNGQPIFAVKVHPDTTYLYNIPSFLDRNFGFISSPIYVYNVYAAKNITNHEILYILTSKGLYSYTNGKTVCRQINFADDSFTTDPSNSYNIMGTGKKLRFRALFTNNTVDTIESVTGKIRCSSPYVKITDSLAVYRDILSNVGFANSTWSDDWFEIELDTTTPNNYVFHFEIIYDNATPSSINNSYTFIDMPFINSPCIVTGTSIIDTATQDYPIGDGDGIIEPMETAEIGINVKNISDHYLNSITAKLISPFPQLSIWHNHAMPNGTGAVYNVYSIGAIQANQTMSPVGKYVVTDSFEVDYKLPFSIILKGTLNTFSDVNGCQYDYGYINYCWGTDFSVNNGFDLPPDSLLPGYTTPDTTIIGLIDVTKENQAVTVYPNPNQGKFALKTDFTISKNEIKIYNMLGEPIPFELYENKGTNYFIDISYLPDGVYFIEIGSSVHKMIKN